MDYLSDNGFVPHTAQEEAQDRTHGAQKKRKRIRIKWFAKRGAVDVTFLILVMILLLFGLIMLFSASYAAARYKTGDSFHYIKNQLIFAAMGVTGMIVISFIDYNVLRRFAIPIYCVAVLLLIIALILPPTKGNFHRWIAIGGIGTFQPSEIAKFAIVLLFAHLIAAYGEKMSTFKYGVAPFIITLGVVAVLTVLEPHVSGTILILLLGAIMMLAGGTRLKWFGLGLVFMAIAAGVFLMVPKGLEYAAKRVDIWMDPYSDPLGDGFQTIQSLIAIGSGGLMGKGLGDSRQKYLYIPEPQNDYIFSVVCEELGFVGAAIIIILFALLIWRGFIIAMRAKDKFGSMLAMGLTMQVGIQTLLNIAVVTNSVPPTGISLPFFSYGGTALLMLLFQMGVVLSISREARIVKE